MRTDGLHSKRGGRASNGSGAPAQDPCNGARGALGGGEGVIPQASGLKPVEDLFAPVEEDLMDCPGGVCPVPWANKPAMQPETVNHPSHYNDGGIECIDAIEAALTEEEFKGFLKGNIFKYLWRENLKGGQESIEKGLWYYQKLKDLKG